MTDAATNQTEQELYFQNLQLYAQHLEGLINSLAALEMSDDRPFGVDHLSPGRACIEILVNTTTKKKFGPTHVLKSIEKALNNG